MNLLSEMFSSGRIIDVIIALMVLETLALSGLYKWTGRGVAPVALLPFMAAGVCLMLALRLALTDADWLPIAGLLLLAFVFHALDIALRWRRKPG